MIQAIRKIFVKEDRDNTQKPYMVVRQVRTYENTDATIPVHIHTVLGPVNRPAMEFFYGQYMDPILCRRITYALDDYLSRNTIIEHTVVIVMRHFYVGKFILTENKNHSTVIFYVRSGSDAAV
jgi:hypothetical protein